jgi:hypothetical protein
VNVTRSRVMSAGAGVCAMRRELNQTETHRQPGPYAGNQNILQNWWKNLVFLESQKSPKSTPGGLPSSWTETLTSNQTGISPGFKPPHPSVGPAHCLCPRGRVCVQSHISSESANQPFCWNITWYDRPDFHILLRQLKSQ